VASEGCRLPSSEENTALSSQVFVVVVVVVIIIVVIVLTMVVTGGMCWCVCVCVFARNSSFGSWQVVILPAGVWCIFAVVSREEVQDDREP
jgi:hypothetical protein